VSGTLATDTLHIGGLSPSVTFGLATNVSSEFKSYPMDGILGIGRGANVKGAVDAPQIMDALKDSNLISSKLYGIHLSRSPALDGELNLGAPNTALYSGTLNWQSCIPSSAGFWEVAISDASVAGKSLNLRGKTGIMDTGTSYILMPPADALAIHTQIPGFAQTGETFSVPCSTQTDLAFVFGETAYNISTKDWLGGKLSSGLCQSKIVGRQTFNESQWLIGDVFLKNVYAVFDFEGSRVGLGTPRSGDQGAGSEAASGASTSAVPTGTGTGASQTSAAATQTAALEASPASSSAISQGQSAQSGAGMLVAPLLVQGLAALLFL
jgi:hypothetical protein